MHDLKDFLGVWIARQVFMYDAFSGTLASYAVASPRGHTLPELHKSLHNFLHGSSRTPRPRYVTLIMLIGPRLDPGDDRNSLQSLQHWTPSAVLSRYFLAWGRPDVQNSPRLFSGILLHFFGVWAPMILPLSPKAYMNTCAFCPGVY